MEGISVAEAVRRILESEPCFRECLARRVANYSAMARHIKPWVETLVGAPVSEHAVKMALVRFEPSDYERVAPRRRVLEVLAKSSVELRSGIGVVTAYSKALPRILEASRRLAGESRIFLLLSALTTFTVILDEDHADSLVEELGDYVISVYRRQAAVILVSPPEIISTPGVIAYITGLLAREGVNITQIESIHTDTILVVREDQAMKALETLHRAIRVARQQLAG
ncbi:MAG: ACT domain-containing protein [Desulfurococcales archaeon]|nr:ACT domain-containing protein [Desulfurococcales archaeon]